MNKLNNKRPSLFIDNDDIKKYRKRGQNKLQNDETLAFFLFRPFSIYISYYIFKKTKITANSITFIMTLLGLLGTLCIPLFDNINHVLIFTLLYFTITYLLDVIDGEVARLRNTTSKIGVILDASLWFYYPLAYTIAVYTISEKLNIGIWFPSIVLAGSMHDLYCYISTRLFKENSSSSKQSTKTIVDLTKIIFSKIIFFLLLLVIWNTSNTINFTNVFITLTLFVTFLYFVKNTLNLSKLLAESKDIL